MVSEGSSSIDMAGVDGGGQGLKRLACVRVCHFALEFFERRFGEILAFQDHSLNFAEVRGIVNRVRIQQHQIGILACVDRAHGCLALHELGTIERCHLKNLQR